MPSAAGPARSCPSSVSQPDGSVEEAGSWLGGSREHRISLCPPPPPPKTRVFAHYTSQGLKERILTLTWACTPVCGAQPWGAGRARAREAKIFKICFVTPKNRPSSSSAARPRKGKAVTRRSCRYQHGRQQLPLFPGRRAGRQSKSCELFKQFPGFVFAQDSFQVNFRSELCPRQGHVGSSQALGGLRGEETHQPPRGDAV